MLVILWSALELRHAFQGGHISFSRATILAEHYSYPILFLGWCLLLYAAKFIQQRTILKPIGYGMFALATIWILLANMTVLSPLLHIADTGTMPILNLLALGFAIPGLLYLACMYLAEKRNDALYAKLASIFGLTLLIIWSAFEVRHAYQGSRIDLSHAMTAAEAYSYPVLALVWSLGLRYLKQANIRIEMRNMGYVMLGLSGLWILFGNILLLSPLVQHWSVGRWYGVNLLALAYLVPAACLAVRLVWFKNDMPKPMQNGAVVAIAALFFIWCNLTLRHAFQGPILALQRGFTDNEYYGYSLLWLVMSGGLFLAAMRWRHKWLEYAFIGLTLVTIGKVFGFDMGVLHGALRALSFIGLGLALIGLGLLYRRFIYQRGQTDGAPETVPAP